MSDINELSRKAHLGLNAYLGCKNPSGEFGSSCFLGLLPV